MIASLCTAYRWYVRGTVSYRKIVMAPGKIDNMQQKFILDAPIETRTGFKSDWNSEVMFIYTGSSNSDNTDLLRLKICPSLTSRRRMEATASLVQRHSATTFTSSRCLHSSGLPSASERHCVIFFSYYILTGV
jgi:hypothetical protein